MKVLVTGGTGVVGQGAVSALLARGHDVRLFSRHAEQDVKQWQSGVEGVPGDIGSRTDVEGIADGCDAVLHVVGIVDENPPDVTFDRINVEGTRLLVRETERAKVGKFVFVSSLGAPTGDSPYHRSKRAAEEIVRAFDGQWIIVRPGNVYGPGDEVISLLLKMVRTLPAIPVIGGGDQPFQPAWYEDVGEALAMAVERHDLARQALDLAGPERTTMNDLIDRLTRLTGREPARIPVPEMFASIGLRLADMFGAEVPINESQLTMLREGNVIRETAGNALTAVFRIQPTSLDEGLAKLADALPEQLPSEGIGSLERKRFWVDIATSRYSAAGLFDRLRAHFARIVGERLAMNAEPGTTTRIEDGSTLTMSLPLRGHCQVRVEEVSDRSLTLVTLDGHPLAGAIRFLTEQRGDQVRFEIRIYDRPATLPDLVMMRTVGTVMQDSTWIAVAEAMIAESGGVAPDGVERETVTLDDTQARRVEKWVRDLVLQRRAESNAEEAGDEAWREASF